MRENLRLVNLGCFQSQYPFWSLNGQLHIFVQRRKNSGCCQFMLTWTVWREWSRQIFDNHSGDVQSLWYSFFLTCSWLKISPLFSMYSVDSFMSNPEAFLLPREIAPRCKDATRAGWAALKAYPGTTRERKKFELRLSPTRGAARYPHHEPNPWVFYRVRLESKVYWVGQVAARLPRFKRFIGLISSHLKFQSQYMN